MDDYDRRPLRCPRLRVASGYGLCPVCGAPGVMRCKCWIGDTTCSNGHTWHFQGEEVHLGEFPHDGTGNHADCQRVQ